MEDDDELGNALTRKLKSLKLGDKNRVKERLINSVQSTNSIAVTSEQATSKTKRISPKQVKNSPLTKENSSNLYPVGFLVVVDGPGTGSFAPVFGGMNSIGRGDENDVVLDFGDKSISRVPHVQLIFDDEKTSYYIHHCGQNNLVRVNDAPVIEPIILQKNAKIRIGNTELMFFALCSKQFNWKNVSA